MVAKGHWDGLRCIVVDADRGDDLANAAGKGGENLENTYMCLGPGRRRQWALALERFYAIVNFLQRRHHPP